MRKADTQYNFNSLVNFFHFPAEVVSVHIFTSAGLSGRKNSKGGRSRWLSQTAYGN